MGREKLRRGELLSLHSLSWLLRNGRNPPHGDKCIFHLIASKALLVGLLLLDIIFYFILLTFQNSILNLKIDTYSNVVVQPAIFLIV